MLKYGTVKVWLGSYFVQNKVLLRFYSIENAKIKHGGGLNLFKMLK